MRINYGIQVTTCFSTILANGYQHTDFFVFSDFVKALSHALHFILPKHGRMLAKGFKLGKQGIQFWLNEGGV